MSRVEDCGALINIIPIINMVNKSSEMVINFRADVRVKMAEL